MFLSSIKISNKHKIAKNKKVGRNNQGRITVRHRGGGHKRLKRVINWEGDTKDSLLIGLQYNPAGKVSLFQWYNTEKKSIYYTPSFKNFSILDGINKTNSLRKSLSVLEIGDKCNNLVINTKTSNSVYVKASGSYAQVLQRYTWIKDYMLVQLPSGEQKLFNKYQSCFSHQLSDYTSMYEKIKKAGRNRWLSKRSSVRGVAMNPVDHPHGGGEGKTSGGRPSVTPKGRLTKKVKTRNNKRTNWQIFLKN